MSKTDRLKHDSEGAKMLLDTIDTYREKGSYVDENRCSDILYITGCTSNKSPEPKSLPAYKRYVGGASRRMLELYEKNNHLFDLYILSAGYGFIPANTSIQKYNVSFNNVDSKLRGIMAQHLQLRADFEKLLCLGYKLVVLRLGPNYIKALNSDGPDKVGETPYNVPDETTLRYIKPKSTDDILLQPIREYSIKTCRSEIRRVSRCKLSNDAQDKIWSDFFEKQKGNSVEQIIKKITNSNTIEELIR